MMALFAWFLRLDARPLIEQSPDDFEFGLLDQFRGRALL